MAELRPFVAFRPPPALARRVAAPLHDWITPARAGRLAADNPLSFVRISHAEVDLGEGVAPGSPAALRQTSANLAEFLERGWLEPEPRPGFFLYRQTAGGTSQTGLVALASVEALEQGAIRGHERTQVAREDARTRHLEAVGGNDEPVLLTYRARAEIDARIAAICCSPPDVDFVAEDRVGHTLWRVRGQDLPLLEEAFRRVPRLYIADGHHRTAASVRLRRKLREEGADSGPHDWFLAVLVPHDQLRILPFHRAVRDLRGQSAASVLDRLAPDFEIRDGTCEALPVREAHQFGMRVEGRWWRLAARPHVIEGPPLGALDVAILQKRVLAPLLGIDDPRTDPRIDFFGGPDGLSTLERRVAGGEFAIGFALHPPAVPQVLEVADAGEVMPPQSTCFEPKLRAGLILYLFRD